MRNDLFSVNAVLSSYKIKEGQPLFIPKSLSRRFYLSIKGKIHHLIKEEKALQGRIRKLVESKK